MKNWASWLEIHDLIFIGVALLLFGALGGGPLVRALTNWVLKIFGHGTSEMIVNVGMSGGEMAEKTPQAECVACGLMVDPTKCMLHQSEHDRSIRNENSIKELWTNYSEVRKEMAAGFKEVQTSLNTGQLMLINTQMKILAALGQRPRDWKTTKDGGGGGFTDGGGGGS